ncbi:MAG: prepilin-type N-terminal cleavage/methylation domain-containing protein, partial [Bacteroidia bacterium]
MKRIGAFTLLEMLIGMLISGLVVAAAFSAFRIV